VNWDIQPLVNAVYDILQSMSIPVWMDIKGGIVGDLNSCMAEGVENSLDRVSSDVNKMIN